MLAHGGRIVKVMGDGVLIEFASAVNTVTVAIAAHFRRDVAELPIAPHLLASTSAAIHRMGSCGAQSGGQDRRGQSGSGRTEPCRAQCLRHNGGVGMNFRNAIDELLYGYCMCAGRFVVARRQVPTQRLEAT